MSIINPSCADKLVAIGLSKYEALAYLALLEKNDTTALDIAERSGIPKQRIYDVLNNLQTKGLCLVQEGRPRCYIAHQPQQALTAVFNYRRQQQAAENDRQARLIEELIPILDARLNGERGGPPAQVQNANDVNAYRDIGGL